MKKIVSTERTDANIARVLSMLTDTPGKLKHVSQRLSVEQLRQPLGRGERSFTEELAHLLAERSRREIGSSNPVSPK